jgi:hypothetical protein
MDPARGPRLISDPKFSIEQRRMPIPSDQACRGLRSEFSLQRPFPDRADQPPTVESVDHSASVIGGSVTFISAANRGEAIALSSRQKSTGLSLLPKSGATYLTVKALIVLWPDFREAGRRFCSDLHSKCDRSR